MSESEQATGVTGKPIGYYEITWSCRFHPTDWFHETGCPHVEWTREQLQSALETMKRNMAYHTDIFRQHPDMLLRSSDTAGG